MNRKKQELELKIIELRKQLKTETDAVKKVALEKEIKNQLIILYSIGKPMNRMISTK